MKIGPIYAILMGTNPTGGFLTTTATEFTAFPLMAIQALDFDKKLDH
jgi:hypothetical protein